MVVTGDKIRRILFITTNDKAQYVLGVSRIQSSQYQTIDQIIDYEKKRIEQTKELEKTYKPQMEACKQHGMPYKKLPELLDTFGIFPVKLPPLDLGEYTPKDTEQESYVLVMTKAKGLTLTDILNRTLEGRLSQGDFQGIFYNAGKQMGALTHCLYTQEPKSFLSHSDCRPVNFIYDLKKNQLYWIDYLEAKPELYDQKTYGKSDAISAERRIGSMLLDELFRTALPSDFDDTDINAGNFESLHPYQIRISGLKAFVSGYFEELQDVSQERQKYYEEYDSYGNNVESIFDDIYRIYKSYADQIHTRFPYKESAIQTYLGIDEKDLTLPARWYPVIHFDWPGIDLRKSDGWQTQIEQILPDFIRAIQPEDIDNAFKVAKAFAENTSLYTADKGKSELQKLIDREKLESMFILWFADKKNLAIPDGVGHAPDLFWLSSGPQVRVSFIETILNEYQKCVKETLESIS